MLCVFLALMFTFATIGPSVGFVLGGQLLNFYVDIDKLGNGRLPTWNTCLCFIRLQLLLICIQSFHDMSERVVVRCAISGVLLL